MNQIDLVILAFLLFGGWLGAIKGPLRASAGMVGTVCGFALASLYASRLVPVWSRLLLIVSRRVSLQVPWVASASTQAVWRQTAHSWLTDLLWPSSLKQLVLNAWNGLPPGETIAGWAKVVEEGFFFALANICAFITVLLVSKLLISLIYGISLRLALPVRQRLSAVGFLVGLLQNSLLVLVVLAFLVPFFLWIGQTPVALSLRTSLAIQAASWLWNSILRA